MYETICVHLLLKLNLKGNKNLLWLFLLKIYYQNFPTITILFYKNIRNMLSYATKC